jgi:lycopene beta-cyclase
MDFSIPQKGNTRFMYILPFSETRALVEYTLFSEDQLSEEEYERAIHQYLTDDLKVSDYTVVEKERGTIPMTCYPFWKRDSSKIVHIGTAGGWAKPSTGYTFRNTAKKTNTLVKHLKTGKSLVPLSRKTRFWLYDLLLLDILYQHNEKGGFIFETLFSKRKPQLLFRFLDEETSFWEDLKVISGCPKGLFIRALFKRLLCL